METWYAFIVSNEFHYQRYLIVYPPPSQTFWLVYDSHVTCEELHTQKNIRSSQIDHPANEIQQARR